MFASLLEGPKREATKIIRISLKKERYCSGRSKCFSQFLACFCQTGASIPVRLDTVRKKRSKNSFWREFLLIVREELALLPSWITPCERAREIALRRWGCFATCRRWPVPVRSHRERGIGLQDRIAGKSVDRFSAYERLKSVRHRLGLLLIFGWKNWQHSRVRGDGRTHGSRRNEHVRAVDGLGFFPKERRCA